MEKVVKDLEFEVLGQKIKLRADEGASSVPPELIVSTVLEEAKKIHEKSPHLSQAQLATLVALKLASEKLSLDKEYRETIEELQLTAKDALQYIEEVSPSTV